jgi:hypothetical protein
MSNPLTSALVNERAQRAGKHDSIPSRKPATANEIDPERVATLATLLVGSAKAEDKKATSYRMNCPSCGAAHTFSDEDLDGWKTDDEAAETGSDDEDMDPDIPDSDDDSRKDDGDDDFEDLKRKAVAAAVQRVRDEATKSEANPLLAAFRKLREAGK